MSARIKSRKAGLAFAGVMVGVHFCWLVFVATGVAQSLIDFLFWLHFIKPVYVIEAFALGRAIILLAVTASIGFGVGAAFASLWNVTHKIGDRDDPC